MLKVIKGGIIGGVILFLWSAISWMALPWHMNSLHNFTSETAISQAITANTPKSGMYMMPLQENATNGQTHGPMVFAAVHKEGMTSMTQAMIIELATLIIIALLATYLLTKTKSLSYGERVWFIFIFGLASSLETNVPYWNWFHFSTDFTLVAIADVIIAWFLAGLAIAKIIDNKPVIH